MVKKSKINEEKYRNVILFFANKIKNGTLGKLKIMKLLYFIDFDYYEKYGKSITGDEYLKFNNGPVPRMAEKILKDMKDNDIKITRIKIGSGYNDQQHIEPLNDFEIELFTKEELLMMSEIVDKWEKFSGAEMKSASHGEAPWIATKQDEVIEYDLVYYRNKYGEMDNND